MCDHNEGNGRIDKWRLDSKVTRKLDADHRDEIMIPKYAEYSELLMLILYVG